jgi:large subunit ribosomal protein L3
LGPQEVVFPAWVDRLPRSLTIARLLDFPSSDCVVGRADRSGVETIVAIELLCRKIGMTQIFDDSGEAVGVTVLDAAANTVVQKKTEKNDGYTGLQLGFGERRPSRTSKAQLGHFEKAGVSPKQYLVESRVTPEVAAEYEVGSTVEAGIFSVGQHVDVIGKSKGKGTAGVVKRHNVAIKRRTHGTHEAFRHAGSIGAGSYPGRVIKGMGMAGRMGNSRETSLNLRVVKIDSERNLIYIRGAVPGHKNAIVRLRESVKG